MKKGLLVVFGLLCMAAGIVGMFLPVVPTVPFLLLALWAFARGSERLHDWLLHHPRLGRRLRDWHEHQAIPARAKLLSVGSMGVAALWLGFFPAYPRGPWRWRSPSWPMAHGSCFPGPRCDQWMAVSRSRQEEQCLRHFGKTSPIFRRGAGAGCNHAGRESASFPLPLRQAGVLGLSGPGAGARQYALSHVHPLPEAN